MTALPFSSVSARNSEGKRNSICMAKGVRKSLQYRTRIGTHPTGLPESTSVSEIATFRVVCKESVGITQPEVMSNRAQPAAPKQYRRIEVIRVVRRTFPLPTCEN